MKHGPFSDETSEVLRRAGWHENRRLADEVEGWSRQLSESDGFLMFPAARAALEEFGGLRLEPSGPGVDHARVSFELVPTLALGERDRFSLVEADLKEALYPLGEVGGGHAFLAVSTPGHVYLLTDELVEIGASVAEAIENLVLGRRYSGVRRKIARVLARIDAFVDGTDRSLANANALEIDVEEIEPEGEDERLALDDAISVLSSYRPEGGAYLSSGEEVMEKLIAVRRILIARMGETKPTVPGDS